MASIFNRENRDEAYMLFKHATRDGKRLRMLETTNLNDIDKLDAAGEFEF